MALASVGHRFAGTCAVCCRSASLAEAAIPARAPEQSIASYERAGVHLRLTSPPTTRPTRRAVPACNAGSTTTLLSFVFLSLVYPHYETRGDVNFRGFSCRHKGRASVFPFSVNYTSFAIRPHSRSRFAPQADPGRDGQDGKLHDGDPALNRVFGHVLPLRKGRSPGAGSGNDPVQDQHAEARPAYPVL